MDHIFKALADENRRKMLDLLKEKPGMTLSELCKHFKFSRYAVMQHLGVLEEAELIISEKRGRFKHHYLNVIPLQYIYDRWFSEYSSLWAKGLTKLKYDIEKDKSRNKNKSK